MNVGILRDVLPGSRGRAVSPGWHLENTSEWTVEKWGNGHSEMRT